MSNTNTDDFNSLTSEDYKKIEEILKVQMKSDFSKLSQYLLARNLPFHLIDNFTIEDRCFIINFDLPNTDEIFLNNLLGKLFEDYGFIIKKHDQNKYLIQYVGKKASKVINENQISLEEYYKLSSVQILNYNRYKERINKLLNNHTAKNKINKCKSIGTTRYGCEIEHYSVGNGEKHLVIVGGTNGDEIISVDYVLSLMEEISFGELSNIDLDYFTIDFFPLQNPEGFIITTSIIDEYFYNGMSIREMQDKCILYKMSCTIDKGNHQDNSKYGVFSTASFSTIPSKYYSLKNAVKKIIEQNHYQPQCVINWEANGSGVNLTSNSSDNPDFEKIKNGEILYSKNNGNLCRSLPGPIGVPSINPNTFLYEAENICLFNYIAKLYQSGSFAGIINYQASNKIVLFDSNANGYFPSELNESLNGLSNSVEDSDIDYAYSFLGSIYPVVELINLPIDEGSFVAPYSDIFGSYRKCIANSHIEFKHRLRLIKVLNKLLENQYEKDTKKIK